MKSKLILLILIVLSYIAITHYSATELTRHIIAWDRLYGDSYLTEFKYELLLIWSTFMAGVAINAAGWYLALRRIK